MTDIILQSITIVAPRFLDVSAIARSTRHIAASEKPETIRLSNREIGLPRTLLLSI